MLTHYDVIMSWYKIKINYYHYNFLRCQNLFATCIIWRNEKWNIFIIDWNSAKKQNDITNM